ncbi:hypothetical protein [Breznakia pachnodae]|uniref:Uncharacterized protein n=1 Tax=Breznakia pachnodae TaxID=265178 RepID=A0ABU0E154_9FIRM|nr:hypothetical protein [Breznakia pachnodae]MDQ0360617.1 hypothetical protein [Breznakia pachnodae]
MKRVIIRKEILKEYSSINVDEIDLWNYDSKVADEIDSISQEEILAKYYKDGDFEKLYSYYNKIKDTGKNNDYFACAYELSDDYIVQIDDEGHINLYRKDTRIVKDKIEWTYVVEKNT